MRAHRWRSVALAAAVVVTSPAMPSGEPAFRQQPSAADSSAATKLVADGFAELDEGRFDDAKILFDRAISIAREQGLPRIEADAYRGLGRTWAHKNDLPAAREALAKSLALFEALGDHAGIGRVWNQTGTNAFFRQLWDEAVTGYRRALAEFERVGLPGEEANVLRNLTFVPTVPQDERLRLIAAAVRRANDAKAPALEGLSLHQWGDLLVRQNEYTGAMTKYDESRALLDRVGNGAQLARLYTSIGRMYRLHGEPAKALPYYQRAFERQLASRDEDGQVQTLNAIALANHVLGRSPVAQAHYERALRLARQTGVVGQVGFIQRQFGIFLAEIGSFARGATLLEEGLRSELTPADRVRGLSALAKAYASMGRLDDAESTATEAIRLAQDSPDLEARRSALFARAEARRGAGRTTEAIDDTKEALLLVEQLRPNLVPADAFRLGFGERMRFQFNFAVSLFIETGRTEDAFVATEQGRARAFRDLLNSQAVGVASAEQFAATTERPGHAPAAAPSLERLRQTASRLQSTVLSFWVTPRESFVLLVLRDGTVHSHVVRVPALRLDQLVRGTWAGMPSSSPSVSQRNQPDPWRELYDLLILPVRPWMPRGDGNLLTIIPDGPLSRLSFAALQNERGRYLLEGYRLHYAPALSILEFTARARPAGISPDRMLLVANPSLATAMARTAQLGPLEGASREAAAIARLHPASDVQTLSGREATEARVRAAAPAQMLLHFATHGVVRDDRPFDSFLALAAGVDAPTDDGRLTAREIYALDLQASLVVLSACRSAGGRITGDGIVGLTRAFMSAGVPSVVASIWDLPDETAPWLFERFYAARGRVTETGVALRQAQLELLFALRHGKISVETRAGSVVVPAHPAVWAGLQLWGEP